MIHHTDCGMLTFTNQQLREKLADEAGVDASGIDFLPFSDLRQSVADDVHRILDTPQLDDAIAVSGYIYDVHSGALELVVPAATRARCEGQPAWHGRKVGAWHDRAATRVAGSRLDGARHRVPRCLAPVSNATTPAACT